MLLLREHHAAVARVGVQLPLKLFPADVNNRLVIINIPHLHLDPIQPGPLRSMKPPMAADDLIPALCAAAHGQIGKDTVLPNKAKYIYKIRTFLLTFSVQSVIIIKLIRDSPVDRV